MNFLGLRWPTYQLLFGTFLMNQLHSEVSDILTKRLCKTNIYFPLDLHEFPMFDFFPSLSGLSGWRGRGWCHGQEGVGWKVLMGDLNVCKIPAPFPALWSTGLISHPMRATSPRSVRGRTENSSTPSHQLLWLVKLGLEEHWSFLSPSVIHLSFSGHVLMQNNSWETERVITAVDNKYKKLN